MMGGCGRPFHVKARTDLPPATYPAKVQAKAVEIQAGAITDEDFLYSAFDANLILAGILPVRLMITNTGEQPLNLKKTEWEIKDGNGMRCRLIEPRRAFGRLISYYEIRTYNRRGFNRSRDDFVSYALDRNSVVEPGRSRDGFLFFEVPPGVANQTGLTLEVRGIASGATGKKADAELKLK